MRNAPKVLIIDDDRDQLAELADLVANFGYRCLAVDNAREGVSLACTDPEVGIVLIDINLPGTHGLDVLTAIQSYVDDRRATQYLLVTGQPDIEDAIEGFDRGALTFLVKPLDPRALEAELDDALVRIRDDGRPAGNGFRNRLQKIMELRDRLAPGGSPSGMARLMTAVRDVSTMGRRLAPSPLSLKALNLLSEIARSEEACEKLSVVALCLAVDMPQTTGLRCLQDLIDAGLVDKHRDPLDGRRQFVTLSPAGRERLRALVETTPVPHRQGAAR